MQSGPLPLLSAESFEPVGTGTLDARARIALGKAVTGGARFRIYRNAVGQILLDPLLELSASGVGLTSRSALTEAARPVLRRIGQETGESVNLMVREGLHSTCIAQIDSVHSLRISAQVGGRQDLRLGAASRVLLANSPQHVQDEVLGQEPAQRRTADTITDPVDLREVLAQVRRDGHFVSRGELDVGVIAVAAPVRDLSGSVVAALSLAAPEVRVPPARLAELVGRVLKGADGLSLILGFASREREFAAEEV